MFPIQQNGKREFCVSRTRTLQENSSLLYSQPHVLHMDNTSYTTTKGLQQLTTPQNTLTLLTSTCVRWRCMVGYLSKKKYHYFRIMRWSNVILAD